jgi:orotate phosphoribosyltransferase
MNIIHPVSNATMRFLVELMEKNHIIRHDPKGKLPLKSGGTTDLYFNLRDVRSHPCLMKQLPIGYQSLLEQLMPDRIVEIPHGVTPLAVSTSMRTNIPLVTIREQEKDGRVSDAKSIGDLNAGEKVCVLDDVITDGFSKVSVIKFLQTLQVEVLAVVVMVDREDGWQEMFKKHHIDVPVISVMTITDVRDILASRE